MTMTAAELQSYVDAGLVPSTSGISEIDTPITINGSRRVLFEPNAFTWTGSSSRAPFEYDWLGSGGRYPTIFNGVAVTSNIDGSSIFKTANDNENPHNLIFDTCDFTAVGAYCIDMNIVDYMVVPVFRDMVTNGPGAMRLRASGGSDFWHATSQMVIDGWTHTGANRLGPAWNFRGTSGLLMENCVDKGSMGLSSAMQSASWVGPLSLLIQAPRTPATITNFLVDWDDANDDEAENCYIGELRTDNTSGTGKHNYVDLINATLNHAAVDASVASWRVMGADASNGHSIIVNIKKCASPKASYFLVGGRAGLWCESCMWQPGEESDADAMSALVESTFVGGFKDRIETSTTKLPSADSSTAATYSGSDLETNYAAEPEQFEEALGG